MGDRSSARLQALWLATGLDLVRDLGQPGEALRVGTLITPIIGAKSVEPRSSPSSRSIASPSASGRENSDSVANPRGPTSTTVPSGESTST